MLTGFVLERRRRQRRHGRGSAGAKHSPGGELLGVSAEEALAERSFSLHQEHHGTTSASILRSDDFSEICSLVYKIKLQVELSPALAYYVLY